MAWTPKDIGDLTGKRALVTGATSGLGFHTARELLAHGAEVVLGVRDTARGAGTADRLATTTGKSAPVVLELDLADLGSVRAAAESATQTYDRIDMLVNNAGVMATPARSTADGFELQVGTNHLGHFALTGLLLPLLSGARVVTVSSFMHRSVRGIARADLTLSPAYEKWDAYSKSKLANLLFMRELDRRGEAARSGLVSVGAHPGYAVTELQKSGPRLGGVGLEQRVLTLGTRLVAQSAAKGAWPSLYAATDPGLRGGEYAGPRFFDYRGAPRLTGMTRSARDDDAARALWEWSLEATGVSFDFGDM